jgi:hypothetical protein
MPGLDSLLIGHQPYHMPQRLWVADMGIVTTGLTESVHQPLHTVKICSD